MKKIIAAAVVASMVVPCFSVSAAERVKEVSSVYGDKSEIHIVYNDKVVKYDDVKPVNTDGRVMIPFRAALENMGASVDYDDSSRLVTAKKGDTTIKFTLMDDTIYVDNNGSESTVKMDTPMIIVDDRTLVPIRFMSNAFGMQVGWDGDTETVVILDADDYFNEFENSAPNISKLLNKETPKYNKEYTAFDVSFDLNNGNSKYSVAANGSIDGKNKDNVAGADVKFNGSLNESSVNDATLNAVVADDKVYFKTDVIEKLAQSLDNAKIKALALIVKSDVWYSIDLNKALTSLGVPTATINIVDSAVSGNTAKAMDTLKSAYQTEGDTDIDTIISLASMFDMYEQMDKYITVTETENGGYSLKMNIKSEDMLNILKNISNISDSDYNQLKNDFKFNISANSKTDATKSTSDANIEVGYADDVSLKMTVSSNAEKDDTIVTPEIPTGAADITDLFVSAIKTKNN